MDARWGAKFSISTETVRSGLGMMAGTTMLDDYSRFIVAWKLCT